MPESAGANYDEKALLAFLTEQKIRFERFEHPEVYTTSEANQYTGSLSGFHAKNLLLTNAAASRFFLYVCHEYERCDTKGLAKVLESGRLSFAGEEALHHLLGIGRGALSPFALINDSSRIIQLVMAESVLSAEKILFHPLVNTATLLLSLEDFMRFISLIGREARIFTSSPEISLRKA